jgi:uncharacterized protein (DUF2384 family)
MPMRCADKTSDIAERLESRLANRRREVVLAVELEIARLVRMRKGLSEVDTEVLLAAIDSLGSAESAARWLTNPAILLNEASPLVVAATEEGKEQVLQLLRKIELGMLSSGPGAQLGLST